MSNIPSDVVLFLLVVVLSFLVYTRRKKSVLPLPPGPPKLPIIGNLFNLPSQPEWEYFHRWGKEYSLSKSFPHEVTENIFLLESDVIHLSVAGMSLIVLNSVKAANDLLDKRSSIYSNR